MIAPLAPSPVVAIPSAYPHAFSSARSYNGADLLEAGEESFDRLININLKGPYFLSQLVALRMIEQVKSGNLSSMGLPRIVNISSVSGYAPSTNRGRSEERRVGQETSAAGT